MNYLAHGCPFLDDPPFTAGTALPDWLRVAAPRIRIRPGPLQQALQTVRDDPERRLLEGILRHQKDDAAFHTGIAFQTLSARITAAFRDLMPGTHDHRPALLGHVVPEMLLDNELERRRPGLLADYYETLAAVDPDWIQQTITPVLRQPPQRLAEFIRLFGTIRFLYDYADNARFLYRINQVLSRIGLAPCGTDVFPVFDLCRRRLTGVADELLQFRTQSDG